MADSPALKESPSQTAGPYVHIGCTPNFVGISGVYPQDAGRRMLNERTKGERICVNGCVFDGAGKPLTDALIEIWQADADGLYNSPSEPRGKADPEFTGWGRQPVDLATGRFSFDTIRPGPVPFADGRMQAPHISLWIVARGINLGLSTRLYFDDESEANAADPVLASIPDPARRNTLLAHREGDAFLFDIHLQGPDETVFFDV
uniref:protocatechuate 3,4-dioxygenase subunit alpha n=1 Tax=Pararhizobium sp. IMCC3301 TaxID=3067904 RepID=UPI002741FE0E|nr:protocatechuate 3,4-dioxygenase subunit alpha [Pararhizobium sp. IMCC3301]